MDIQTLTELLERDEIKNDEITSFHLKACKKVMDEYGGRSGDWYVGSNRTDDDNKIIFFRVLENRIDQVLVKSEEMSTFKSTLSFKHIIGINVDDEKIEVITAYGKYRYEHLKAITFNDEEFHKVLIAKFDRYCDNYF